jgi:hypothetical protein
MAHSIKFFLPHDASRRAGRASRHAAYWWRACRKRRGRVLGRSPMGRRIAAERAEGAGRRQFAGALLAALLAATPVRAQVPPPPAPPSEPAEISACLCLQQLVATLSAEMNQRRQALDGVNQQLSDLDAQLAQARANLNVNDPDAVARYKAVLERRDAAYRQSIGPVHTDATQATARYNEGVSGYNARCANRPFNSALVADIQAHLSCPPIR